MCTCNSVYLHIKAGMNSQYQIKASLRKFFKGFKGLHVFLISVAPTLIGYRKPPKLDYYFITSTSLVPVAVSTRI